jgi:hypothetical protein
MSILPTGALVVDVFVRPLADAFMQVGVFVAFLVAPFGWARYRWGHRFDSALERRRRLGPLVAALLTVPPGCGIAPRLRHERAAVPATVPAGDRGGAVATVDRAHPGPPVLSSSPGVASPVVPPRVQEMGPMLVVLWTVLTVGLVLGLPVTFQLLDPSAVGAAVLGDIDPYLALGTVGRPSSSASPCSGSAESQHHPTTRMERTS